MTDPDTNVTCPRRVWTSSAPRRSWALSGRAMRPRWPVPRSTRARGHTPSRPQTEPEAWVRGYGQTHSAPDSSADIAAGAVTSSYDRAHGRTPDVLEVRREAGRAGGVLCPGCVEKLAELARGYWTTGPGAQLSPVPPR
jgi:hypothetical protein